MSITFAAAQTPHGVRAISSVAKAMAMRARQRVANDNGFMLQSSDHPFFNTDDKVLRAALRHFAQHGLGAAREARANAESAFVSGDRESYRYWLNITRSLDRRLAREAARVEADSPKSDLRIDC